MAKGKKLANNRKKKALSINRRDRIKANLCLAYNELSWLRDRVYYFPKEKPRLNLLETKIKRWEDKLVA